MPVIHPVLLPGIIAMVLHAYLTGLDPTLFSAAETATVEAPVQKLFTHVADVLCNTAGNGLHACDTHERGYPESPCHKIDILICSEPKPLKGPVGCTIPFAPTVCWPWFPWRTHSQLLATHRLLKQCPGQCFAWAPAAIGSALAFISCFKPWVPGRCCGVPSWWCVS